MTSETHVSSESGAKAEVIIHSDSHVIKNPTIHLQ